MKYLAIVTAALLTAALPLHAAEKLISTVNGTVHLGGVLDTADAKNAPVVLIIPGSGPTDRDGNNALGGKAQSYKLLAAALNAKGITVARIDKRGMFGSINPGTDPNDVTLALYASDVAAWVETLRKETHAPCIWLLGHSEGSQIAEVAAIHTPHLCGLVLASAAGQPLDVVLRNIDVFSHDPVAELSKSHGPVLVIEGSHDHQIDPGDGERLKAARPGVQAIVIEGMGHNWKDSPTDAASDTTRGNPGLPVSQPFVDAVAGFVKAPESRTP